MGVTIRVNNTTLPGGVVAIKRSDELLWSEGTGRSATSGNMVGSVVAKKQTYSIEWGVITQAQYDAIRSAIVQGFFTLTITVGSTTLANISAYRGTISGQLLSTIGTSNYWKGVTVDVVER